MELAHQGIKLDSVVRALWEIVSVEYSGQSKTPDLKQYRAAEEFPVLLRPGSGQHEVIVDVFWGALEILEHKLGFAHQGMSPENALPAGHILREMVAPVVRTFPEEQLRHGGTSCWDPLLSSRLEFTATDMSFLLGQSTAFDELRQAISDACDPPVVDGFLGSLSASSVKIHDFDTVLPELSTMLLGGAYRNSETLSTNASDLYHRLDRTEQELLRKYYEEELEQLKLDPRFATLPNKYPKVFTGA